MTSRITIILIVVYYIIPFRNLIAQIGGVSGSKLIIPDADVLDIGTFEFEPSFSVLHSSKMFNNEGDLESRFGENISSDLCFRITAGISENIETGIMFSSPMNEISLGIKHKLFNSNEFRLALIGGISLPAENEFIPDSIKHNRFYGLSIGTIITNNFSEMTSIDFLLSYTGSFDKENTPGTINCGLGVGHYFSENLQLACELNFIHRDDNGAFSRILSCYSGITYQFSPTLLVVLGSQYDLVGRNEEKSIGYFSAFTFLFK